MSFYEIITIVISSLAIITSFASLIQNYRLSKRQSELEIQQTKLVEKQLDLINDEEVDKKRTKIRLLVMGRIGSSKLMVRNEGHATAYGVNIEVHARAGKKSPLIDSDLKSKFPLKHLDPGDSVELYWAIDSSTGTEFDSICKWKNEDGTDDIKETLLA